MRYAILSDIHSNLEALQAVLAETRRLNIRDYVCLGDIVGYGADPNSCLESMRSVDALTVLGNHDAVACGRADISFFVPHARRAALWTKERLNPAERNYLASLPLTLHPGEYTLVHSSLHSPESWHYIMSLREAYFSFACLTNSVCFFGHSHRPVVFRKMGGRIRVGVLNELSLEEGARYLVNLGSVGQPRDGDPRAAFGVFDTDEKTVRIVRVEYAVEKAQEKILSAGLPSDLAARLAEGL